MVNDSPQSISASLADGAPEPETPQGEPAPPAARERIPLAIFWFVLVAALLLFIAFGSVALHYSGAHPKITPPSHERIIRVWIDQADRLPRADTSSLTRVLYFLALPIILIGTAAAMWLALIAKPDHEAIETAAPAWDQVERPPASGEAGVAGDRE